jgi:HSP20 family molecular chaperone IbpA
MKGRTPKIKKIITIDRVLLLGILVFQAIILFKYLSPKQDSFSQNKETTINAKTSSNSRIRENDPSLPMRLPLPPGYDDNEHIRDSQENVNNIFNEMQKEMHRMMQRAHEDFDVIDRIMSVDDDWNTLIRSPSMDMKEENDNYIIAISIPGTNISNVAISLKDRLLTIKSHYEMSDSMGTSHQQQEKRILLPGSVDADKIEKTLSNKGILTIVIPKKVQER